MKKQTKLFKVIKWLNSKSGSFTRQDFVKKFGEQTAETTYLCYLMNAKYVDRYARGIYRAIIHIPLSLNEPTLRDQAYPNRKKRVRSNNDVFRFV